MRESTAALVRLHGLSGQAGKTILATIGGEFAIERAPDADKAGVLGGLVSGALGGLAADLATGGLTFGAGALLGGLAGALGARTLALRYNAQRGTSGSEVLWSEAFVVDRLAVAMLRYLAVAHFGRGRGEFVAGEVPAHWTGTIQAVLSARAEELAASLRALRETHASTAGFATLVQSMLWQVLTELYPQSAASFAAGE